MEVCGGPAQGSECLLLTPNILHLIFCSFHLEHWALMLQGWNAVPLSLGSLGAVLCGANCGPFVPVCAAGWYLRL